MLIRGQTPTSRIIPIAVNEDGTLAFDAATLAALGTGPRLPLRGNFTALAAAQDMGSVLAEPSAIDISIYVPDDADTGVFVGDALAQDYLLLPGIQWTWPSSNTAGLYMRRAGTTNVVVSVLGAKDAP